MQSVKVHNTIHNNKQISILSIPSVSVYLVFIMKSMYCVCMCMWSYSKFIHIICFFQLLVCLHAITNKNIFFECILYTIIILKNVLFNVHNNLSRIHSKWNISANGFSLRVVLTKQWKMKKYRVIWCQIELRCQKSIKYFWKLILKYWCRTYFIFFFFLCIPLNLGFSTL